LAAQAPCDLGHEVFRKPQVIEGLPQGLGSLLRLAAVARQALLRCAITASSGFRVGFGVSYAWGHGVLLWFVEVCGDGSLS